MRAAEWIKQTVPNFNQLAKADIDAITDFSLLWSLYEGEVLEESGCAARIIEKVGQLSRRGPLILAPLVEPIAYFRQRYVHGIEFSADFYNLDFKRNDRRDVVERFLRATTNDEAEVLSGMLIIVYRLRNNLFHGKKWRYGIKGQFSNFQHSNRVLMTVIDFHRCRAG